MDIAGRIEPSIRDLNSNGKVLALLTKHILVTGTAGFIGSHVAQTLLERGDRVTGIDNLNDYYDPARKRSNLREVAKSPGGDSFAFVEGDIRDEKKIASLFADNRFDGVANLAAMAGVRASLDDPALYYDVNLNGTLVLLDACRDADPHPNFVQASTSSVYGASQQMPFIESDPCDRPLAPYPASKRAAEMLGFTYHHIYKLDITNVRFFTVYGPRGRPDMMAYKVADNIHYGKEVSLYNNGRMHRDWTFVSDVAAGVVAAVDRRLGYEVINLGRGEPILLADFVGFIEEHMGKRANLKSAEMPIADIPYTYADITKARDLLDYDPNVSVREGIERFLNWYEARAALENA